MTTPNGGDEVSDPSTHHPLMFVVTQ